MLQTHFSLLSATKRPGNNVKSNQRRTLKDTKWGWGDWLENPGLEEQSDRVSYSPQPTEESEA